jgi:hypothetical protein
MSRGGRLVAGLLLGAVLGIAVAFVGVLTTPTNWCDELPQPIGQNLLDAGMIVAAIGGLAAAATLAYTAPRSLRGWLVLAAVGGAYFALVVLANHSSGGWGASCG